MVLAPTPRTEEAPPGPGSQILPTPGHSPFVAMLDVSARLVDVAASEGVNESATYVAASTTVATASRSAVLRSSTSSLRNTVSTSNATVVSLVISDLLSTLRWVPALARESHLEIRGRRLVVLCQLTICSTALGCATMSTSLALKNTR